MTNKNILTKITCHCCRLGFYSIMLLCRIAGSLRIKFTYSVIGYVEAAVCISSWSGSNVESKDMKNQS